MGLRRSIVTDLLIQLLITFAACGAEPIMVSHHIDVGQGASTLLEFPCGAVLIDTGGQDPEHVERLAGYLRSFFERRSDLHNTLNTLIITHPHIDHTRGIRAVTEVCRVRNYVDDGVVEGSGKRQVEWIRNNANELAVNVRDVSDDEITALPNKRGLTDESIDPVRCDGCDPKIVVLSGHLLDNPGWSQSAFRNWNNHSLVVRVEFGKAAFLFTGDLEEPAIDTLIEYYRNTGMLDVDVYQVGHHGSHNGTTRELVERISPSIAVIPAGRWDFGRDQEGGFTTFQYGHPRKDVIDILEELTSLVRPAPASVTVFNGSRASQRLTVTKQIFCTGWEGDIRVTAKLDGTLGVESAPSDDRPIDFRSLAKLDPKRRSPSERLLAFDSASSSLERTADDKKGIGSLTVTEESGKGQESPTSKRKATKPAPTHSKSALPPIAPEKIPGDRQQSWDKAGPSSVSGEKLMPANPENQRSIELTPTMPWWSGLIGVMAVFVGLTLMFAVLIRMPTDWAKLVQRVALGSDVPEHMRAKDNDDDNLRKFKDEQVKEWHRQQLDWMLYRFAFIVLLFVVIVIVLPVPERGADWAISSATPIITLILGYLTGKMRGSGQ